jgi:hypothetical protein
MSLIRLPLYSPSNGDEGEWFMGRWCYRCAHWQDEPETAGQVCNIHLRAISHDTDEPEYPREWCTVPGFGPICTAFEYGGGD